MLCLDILFNYSCFHLLEEYPWDPLSLLSFSQVWSTHSINPKHQNYYLSFPYLNSAKIWPHPWTQNLPVPFFQQNPQKLKSNPLHFIPSPKLVFYLFISSPIDYLSLRLTRREPSPVLVGLATRLSVVWCGPRTLSFQPEANLGSIKVVMGWWKKWIVV